MGLITMSRSLVVNSALMTDGFSSTEADRPFVGSRGWGARCVSKRTDQLRRLLRSPISSWRAARWRI